MEHILEINPILDRGIKIIKKFSKTPTLTGNSPKTEAKLKNPILVLPKCLDYDLLMSRPSPDQAHFRFDKLYHLSQQFIQKETTDGRTSEIFITSKSNPTYKLQLIDGYPIYASLSKTTPSGQHRSLLFVQIYPDRLEESDPDGPPLSTRVVTKETFGQTKKHHTREGIDLWLRVMEQIVEPI